MLLVLVFASLRRPPILALGLLERRAISYFRRGLVLRANAMWQAPTSTHPFSLPPGICDLYAVLSLRISSCAKAEESFLKQAMWALVNEGE
jgi:hypothetical protein